MSLFTRRLLLSSHYSSLQGRSQYSCNSFPYSSHSTVGVALFGSNVTERLASSREELPVSTVILRVKEFLILAHTNVVYSRLRKRISGKPCFGWYIELLMSGAQEILPHPYRGMTHATIGTSYTTTVVSIICRSVLEHAQHVSYSK